MTKNRRQVSILLLTLFLLEVSGLGSIDNSNRDSNGAPNGLFAGRSNGRPNCAGYRCRGTPLYCPNHYWICLDKYGEPVGKRCVKEHIKTDGDRFYCQAVLTEEMVLELCKYYFPGSVNVIKAADRCYWNDSNN